MEDMTPPVEQPIAALLERQQQIHEHIEQIRAEISENEKILTMVLWETRPINQATLIQRVFGGWIWTQHIARGENCPPVSQVVFIPESKGWQIQAKTSIERLKCDIDELIAEHAEIELQLPIDVQRPPGGVN